MSNKPLKPRPREEGRPDPEALLARYHLQDHDLIAHSEAGEEGEQRKRGHLCVYLGAVPYVGPSHFCGEQVSPKSYAHLPQALVLRQSIIRRSVHHFCLGDVNRLYLHNEDLHNWSPHQVCLPQERMWGGKEGQCLQILLAVGGVDVVYWTKNTRCERVFPGHLRDICRTAS